MNKKAKTKAWKADEDANLDEALDESFPASDARFALFNIKWDIAESLRSTMQQIANPPIGRDMVINSQ